MKRLSALSRRAVRAATASAIFIVLFAVDLALSPSWYIMLPLFLALYIYIGYDVVIKAVKNIAHGQIMDENFLMIIATVGAFVLGDYAEAAAVMVFYQIGEFFQSYAVGKTRASVSSLMELSPDEATVLRGGEEVTVLPEEVRVGETVVVRPGERVPVDGVVVEGAGAVDTSALTGEAQPRDVSEGSEVLSGSIDLTGLLKLRCEKEYSDSTVARILELVENASAKKARAENFITRFAAVYTPAVVLLAVLLAVVPPLFLGIADGAVWSAWVYRALTFLVVSCPCALVISVPLSFFGAIGGASKAGILVKGGVALETLARTDVFLLDKTGTITESDFTVVSVTPESDRDRILSAAAIAESGSVHPLARAVCAAAPHVGSEGVRLTELAGRGVRAELDGRMILAGNRALLAENGIEVAAGEAAGTVVYVAENGKFLGAIEVGARVKPDSSRAVAELKDMGVKCVMLTGDNEAAAARTAAAVGIAEYSAGLLPGDKVACTEKYLGRKNGTAFVGDGINDAPVLMRADVGVAMGGVGSDAAIEAADVVLMRDSLTALPKIIRIARRTMRIVRENIAFALTVKLAALVLGALGIAGIWVAIFADVGVTVLAILNSMRMLLPQK